MSIFNCCFVTCTQVSQEAGKVVWYSYLFQNFPQLVRIHTVKGFNKVNEAEVLENSLVFSMIKMDVGNLISGSSAFSKSSLYIWKFSVHVLVKPTLKDFEHYLASMWNKHNWTIVWTLFGIPFLCNWNENWHFPVLGPLLSFSNLLLPLSAALQQHHLLGFDRAHL